MRPSSTTKGCWSVDTEAKQHILVTDSLKIFNNYYHTNFGSERVNSYINSAVHLRNKPAFVIKGIYWIFLVKGLSTQSKIQWKTGNVDMEK